MSSSLPVEGLELGGMTRPPQISLPPLGVPLIDRDCESRGEEGSYSTADENIQIASLEGGSSAHKGTSQCRNHCTIPHPVTPLTRSLTACPGRLRAGLGTSARRRDSEERRKRPVSAAVPLSLLTVPSPSGLPAVDMPDVPVAAVPVSAVWCLALAPLACGRHLRARWWLDDGSRAGKRASYTNPPQSQSMACA